MNRVKKMPERTLEYREVFVVSRTNWTTNAESPKEFDTYEAAELECIENTARNPKAFYQIEKFYTGVKDESTTVS